MWLPWQPVQQTCDPPIPPTENRCWYLRLSNLSGEELRAKMEVASEPKKETEEEDTEGIDLICAFCMSSGPT